ncbi:polyprenyl synthetase family protein [Streptomyces beigongshangae]|uniref:polyprenyl synthetase family protein n=1 Tax=Streptomyces beigongshangae TaxID=2841597 RepID=UPI001C85C6A5|nr:polyprenyl synthetase family protein [Streptomyces sp. REN17]
MTLTPHDLGIESLKASADRVLLAFLDAKSATFVSAHHAAPLPDLARPLRDFVTAGGKRLRPLLALLGWHAAGARGDTRTAEHLAASLELFHAFALIHDDVMDRSDTRRGRPTLHRLLESRHEDPDAARFGECGAILLGDLAFVWSDELLHRGHPTRTQLTALLPLLDEMRSEVIQGQYLDLLQTGCEPDVETALTVARYKSAKYTVERPLHLGAALSGAEPALLEALSDYAVPLGEAFQLRDDLLSVFGDPAATGKPALGDLYEGKATVLMALALRHTRGTRLRELWDRPALTGRQASEIVALVDSSGARTMVEDMIDQRLETARTALQNAVFSPRTTTVLHHLADSAVRRAV